MIKKRKGHKLTEETKNKISNINRIKLKEYYNNHPEAKIKLSNINKGKHFSINSEWKKGYTPWNKGKKMSKESRDKMSLNHNKEYKVWNKGLKLKNKEYKVKHCFFNGRQMLRSHKVWTSQPDNFYRVPFGFVIHHLDGNPLNDNPNNLQLLDKKTHQRLHITINMNKYNSQILNTTGGDANI